MNLSVVRHVGRRVEGLTVVVNSERCIQPFVPSVEKIQWCLLNPEGIGRFIVVTAIVNRLAQLSDTRI